LHKRASPDEYPRQKGAALSTSLIAAGVLTVLGLLTMGMPGGLFLGLFKPLLARASLRWASVYEDERLWPAAIVLSLAWPLTIPLGFWVGAHFEGAFRWVAFLFVVLTGTLGFATLSLQVNVGPERQEPEQ